MSRKEIWSVILVTLSAIVIVYAVYRVGENSRKSTASLVSKAKYKQDIITWHNLVRGCERSKLDRSAEASIGQGLLAGFRDTDRRRGASRTKHGSWPKKKFKLQSMDSCHALARI